MFDSDLYTYFALLVGLVIVATPFYFWLIHREK